MQESLSETHMWLLALAFGSIRLLAMFTIMPVTGYFIAGLFNLLLVKSYGLFDCKRKTEIGFAKRSGARCIICCMRQ